MQCKQYEQHLEYNFSLSLYHYRLCIALFTCYVMHLSICMAVPGDVFNLCIFSLYSDFVLNLYNRNEFFIEKKKFILLFFFCFTDGEQKNALYTARVTTVCKRIYIYIFMDLVTCSSPLLPILSFFWHIFCFFFFVRM